MAYFGNVETRVLFLGEPHCGKRSLLHYYIFDQIVEAEAEEQDIASDKNENQSHQNEFIKELHIDNKTLNAHFFVKDIAPDQLAFDDKAEKYDCYVVLFDMGLWPESGNRARQVFNTISSHKKLMVGCKSDLFQKSRARRTHCVPCSVVSNHNIDNVFDQVTEILQFQDVAQQIVIRPPTLSVGSDPSQRKSKNVGKKLFRKVTRLRSATTDQPSKLASTFDPEYAADYEPDLERELSPPSSSENMKKVQRMPTMDSEMDVVDIARIDYDNDDAELENDLPDDYLDNCEEKSLLNSENMVNSKQLLQAAWHQNVKSFAKNLKDLKQTGADFKICDPVNASGDTLLHELIRKPGWLPSLQVLLQSNVLSPNELTQLLNSKNYAGNTALHVVAARGIDEYLDILLKSGIDVMSENERGKTALLVAVEMNKKNIVEMLVKHNKELLSKNDSHGINAYDLAVELRYFDIAEVLKPYFEEAEEPTVLKNNVDLMKLKNSFFELIREEKTEQVFELVKEHPFLVKQTDENGRTPLHIAVLGRNTSELPELLLARDADINHVDENGNTPLHWAACHPTGYTFGKYLIESGAKIDIANSNGNYPLHMAVFSCNFKLVEYLLNNCNPATAGLKKANNDENTALHIVCAIAKTPSQLDRMISMMTENRAETNALNSRKETPLHIAAAAGCSRIHPSLCDQLTAKDIFGNTPLLSAARSLNLAAVQNLLDMGSSLDTANLDNENVLHLLAFSDMSSITEDDSLHCISMLKKLERKNQQRELIRQLLNRSTISTNETPLFYAVSANRINLVKFFLRRGNTASVNAQNIAGNTPLHIGVQAGNRSMVDLLIRKEAKINQPNKEGFTPLHYCCATTHNQVADRLLKKLKPADLSAVTVDGLSTLHLAAQHGNLHLVQKLVEKTLKKDGTSSLLQLKTQHNNTALIYAMSNNHSKVASYLAKRQAFERSENDVTDRVEFRKEPFPHIYPVINHDRIIVVQKLDIFSTTYNIFEGKLNDDDILILEANSASSSVCMAHEVAIMSMIGNHPNVQRLLGACANKYCYLPFLPNCSTLDAILNELIIRRETCDILQILTIAEGIANGMKCLHTATVSKPSILHNALSPRAILIDEQNAKLSSFGAARVHFSEESEKGDNRELTLPSMDEVRYLAPEVIRGEPPSRKADVFSFSIILWQLCTTKVPYSETPTDELVAMLRKDNKRPSLENVDPGLATLIEDCWSSNPKERPSFEEICDRLNAVHVENVQSLGRNRTLPVLKTKASPFPCCKPREFQIMNKLRKKHKDGGSSALYLCTFERIVCVVKMWPPNQSQNEQMKSSLQIFTMKSLCECDYVVRYIYSDTDKNGNKCLFMEYMNKGTVSQLLTDRKAANSGSPSPLTSLEVLCYALPIAKALKFMHKFSTVIVHQDIQAENILLSNREGNKDVVKLGGFSSMHTLQNSEEHEVYRDIEGFALYLYQLLTLTTRVKNNWKSQISKLQLPEEQQPFLGILHSCLDPIERPTSSQLVDRLEVLEKNFVEQQS